MSTPEPPGAGAPSSATSARPAPARTPRNRAPSGSSTPSTPTRSTSASSRRWGREGMPAQTPIKMLLDCDTGVDDTLAILYAALHPDIDLLGVGSVWGNVDVDTATRNSLHTVAMAGQPEVPVARGASGPITGRPAE